MCGRRQQRHNTLLRGRDSGLHCYDRTPRDGAGSVPTQPASCRLWYGAVPLSSCFPPFLVSLAEGPSSIANAWIRRRSHRRSSERPCHGNRRTRNSAARPPAPAGPHRLLQSASRTATTTTGVCPLPSLLSPRSWADRTTMDAAIMESQLPAAGAGRSDRENMPSGLLFGQRNLYYLRVSPYTVIQMLLYLDVRHVAWMNEEGEEVLPAVMELLRPM